MIGPKLRFQVLERDGFRCKYCGRNGKDVTLEVDHVISKANGGTDEINNLVCSCRECNMGKGKTNLGDVPKNLYKVKISDTIYRLKRYFYDRRNTNNLGTLGYSEQYLIGLFLTNYIKGQDGISYCGYVTSPELYGEDSKYGKDRRSIDGGEMSLLFQNGGDFCDDVLEIMFNECRDEIYKIIETVSDDDNWTKNGGRDEYSDKLNFELTQQLIGIIPERILLKYTLFPKKVREWLSKGV